MYIASTARRGCQGTGDLKRASSTDELELLKVYNMTGA